jgi:hypothetical protein
VLRRILISAVGVLLVGDAVGLAALPSGSRHLAGVLPKSGKVVVTHSLRDVRVVVVDSRQKLELVVAYKQHDRWHSVRVDPAPASSNAAWAATTGAGPVPAFSAVYGRAPGDKVVVRWADGQATEVKPTGGVYLSVRPGHVRPEGVDLNPAPAP